MVGVSKVAWLRTRPLGPPPTHAKPAAMRKANSVRDFPFHSNHRDLRRRGACCPSCQAPRPGLVPMWRVVHRSEPLTRRGPAANKRRTSPPRSTSTRRPLGFLADRPWAQTLSLQTQTVPMGPFFEGRRHFRREWHRWLGAWSR